MAKIHIFTQGCTANQSDSEILKGLLAEAGYQLVEENKADLIIYNTCSLKTPTESRLFRKIQDASRDQKIIVAGCFPLSFPDDKRLAKYSLLGSFDFKKVAEAVERTLAGERVAFLSRGAEEKLCLPRIREDKKIAKIVISKGCLGNCSYCAGKLARGKLVSYSADRIIEEARQAIRQGCTRIYLTSQDCGCYGLRACAPVGTSSESRSDSPPITIVELLRQILNLEGNFKVRMGMANPNHIYKLLPKLVEVYRHPKMLRFLHVPVQSGSDRVLKLMNRQYTVKMFKEIVAKFRTDVPEISISTDIIVGFPRETEEDFQKTVSLLKWLRPEVLNSTKYWPRRGTTAGEMKQLPDRVRKERAKIVHELFENQKKARN